jgi:hypothetical protein
MKDYFVLTFSKDCDVLSVSNAVKTLQDAFPDKNIIGLPEMINFRDYTKEELINLLKFYSDYMKGLIDGKNL